MSTTRSHQPRPEDDRELGALLVLSRHDLQARELLAARLVPLCRAWLAGRFRDPHDLDDAVQETVQHTLVAAKAYDGRRRAFPWCASVVRRKGVDVARRLWSQRSHVQSSPDLQERPDEDREALCDDEREVVAAALERLSPEDKELAIGRLIEHRPLASFVREGRSLGTVFRHVSLVRDRLRAELAQPLGYALV